MDMTGERSIPPMRICVPSMGDGGLDAQASEHFGRAPAFTVYDTETETVDVVSNDSHHHGGQGSPPEIVAESGADVLVCGNLGGNAAEKFNAMGIDVYAGAEGTVEEAIERFERGDLTERGPDEDCGHEDHEHGHDHDHGHHHDHDHDEGHGHGHGGGHGHDHGGHGGSHGPSAEHGPSHDHGTDSSE